jgi:cytochrome c553
MHIRTLIIAFIGLMSAPLVQVDLAQAQLAQPANVFVDSIATRVQACVGCHGKEGRATADGFYPRIAGKPAGYLYNQLTNFRDGRRTYQPMAYLVSHLSDAYLQEIADHFSGLDLPYPSAQISNASAEQTQRARQLIMRGDPARQLPACVACHGQSLTGVAPFIPGLLGLPRDYISSQLGAWKIGQRKARAPDCMSHIVKQLQEQDIGLLANWLASQPVPQGALAKPVSLAVLAAANGSNKLPIDCGVVQP